jgi:hypothetical protein
MKRMILIVLITLVWMPLSFADAPLGTAGLVSSGTSIPAFQDFWVYLYPREGRPSREDLKDESELQTRLTGSLAEFLVNTPYAAVRVKVFNGIPDAEETVRLEGASIVECDPYVFAEARQRRLTDGFGYHVLLQRETDLPLVGEFRVPVESPIQKVADLQDKWIGIIHETSGCGRRALESLAKRNLRPGLDYNEARTGYLTNSFLCLQAGIVDAIVVPRDMARRLSDSPIVTRVIETTPSYLPPLFAARSTDLEKYPELIYAARNEIQDYYGPEELVLSSDDLYTTIEATPSEAPAP